MSEDMPHEAGPWRVYRATNGGLLGVGGRDAGGITDFRGGLWGNPEEAIANAERIVACVNACDAANLTNDELIESTVEHVRRSLRVTP